MWRDVGLLDDEMFLLYLPFPGQEVRNADEMMCDRKTGSGGKINTILGLNSPKPGGREVLFFLSRAF